MPVFQNSYPKRGFVSARASNIRSYQRTQRDDYSELINMKYITDTSYFPTNYNGQLIFRVEWE
jgi:hypothetical protein